MASKRFTEIAAQFLIPKQCGPKASCGRSSLHSLIHFSVCSPHLVQSLKHIHVEPKAHRASPLQSLRVRAYNRNDAGNSVTEDGKFAASDYR
jgi:hypothetical protein